ncbi:MAG: hypothetical protein ABI402_08850 [Ferruginibacter sp.]
MPKKMHTCENQHSSRDLLFADQPLEQRVAIGNNEAPWSLFKEAKKHIDTGNTDAAIEALHRIIDLPGLDSRQYLQAHHFLNELVIFSEEYFKLYGVMIEVGTPEMFISTFRFMN